MPAVINSAEAAEVVEHHRHLAGDEVVHRRTGAAVGHVGQLHAGLLLNSLARQMSSVATPEAGVAPLGRVGLRRAMSSATCGGNGGMQETTRPVAP